MSDNDRILANDKGIATLLNGRGKVTEEYLSRLFSANSSLFLPDNCRLMIPGQDSTVFVIEQPPRERLLTWKPEAGDWESLEKRGLVSRLGLTVGDRFRTTFRLSLPFVVFVVRVKGLKVESVRVFFRGQAIRSENDFLLLTGLTKDDTFIPPTISVDQIHGFTSSLAVDEAIEAFWKQEFGMGGKTAALYKTSIPEMATVWEWEHYGLEKPLWVLSAKWIPAEGTIGSIARAEQLKIVSAGKTVDQLVVLSLVASMRLKKQAAESDTTGLVNTPNVAVLIGKAIIRVGDILTAVSYNSEFGLARNQGYTVLGFSHNGRGTWYVRLEGIAKMVPLGSRTGGLADHFEYRQVPEPSYPRELRYDKYFIRAGSRFILTSKDDLPDFSTRTKYRINELVLDREGDAKVRIEGRDGWTYITSQGGRLLSSIRLLVPRIEGQAFTYGDSTLSPNSVVKVTSSNNRSVTQGMILKVQKNREDRGRFITTFEGLGDDIVVCENSNLTFEWETFKYELSDREVVFGDKTLSFGTNTHFMTADPKSLLRLGRLYGFVRLVPSQRSDRHPLDIDLEFEHGNDTLPIVRQSQWQTENANLVPASLVWKEGPTQLSQGQVLKYTGDEVQSVKTGDKLEIRCFVRNEKDSKVTDLVFMNGLSFPLGRNTLEFFKIVDGGREVGIEIKDLHNVNIGSKKEFTVGGSARYNGGSGRVSESRDGQICRISYYSSWHGTINGSFSDGTAFSDAGSQYFTPLSEIFSTRLVTFSSSSLLFRQRDGTTVTLPGSLATTISTVKRGGGSIGNDQNGRPISIGDVVIPFNRNWPDYLSGKAVGQPAIVVAWQTNSDGNFSFLLFEANYGMTKSQNVDNYDNISSGIRERFSGHIGIARFRDSEVLTPIPQVAAETRRRQVGDSVRLREQNQSAFLNGRVDRREAGRIVQVVDKDTVVVDFPNQNGWYADSADLE